MEPRPASAASLLVPEGTILLHVGPHKTGTTSLQAALFAARPALLEQGVRHAGATRNPAAAIRAVTARPSPTDPGKPPSIRYWNQLRRDLRAAREPRVVLSSEFFAWATPEVIARIADDLGQDRVRVVVTVRPIARILPSQWQQNIQAGATAAYEDWLRALFVRRKGAAYTAFWWLHRHDELVARWAGALGTERVTVVVVDERDHGMLLRVFEELLGLRAGTLQVDPDLSNRSLTFAEAEAVRAFNREAKELGVSQAVQAKTMRFGAAGHMKLRRPDPGEARIETPQWALDAAQEAARQIAPALAASGVRIVGDLNTLTATFTGPPADEPAAPVVLDPAVAGRMATGVLLASGIAREKGGLVGASLEPVEVARVPTVQLGAILVRRLVRWPFAALRRVASRRTPET